jgi:hypothetical protein
MNMVPMVRSALRPPTTTIVCFITGGGRFIPSGGRDILVPRSTLYSPCRTWGQGSRQYGVVSAASRKPDVSALFTVSAANSPDRSLSDADDSMSVSMLSVGIIGGLSAITFV